MAFCKVHLISSCPDISLTFSLPDELNIALRKRAIDDNVRFSDVTEVALYEYLGTKPKSQRYFAISPLSVSLFSRDNCRRRSQVCVVLPLYIGMVMKCGNARMTWNNMVSPHGIQQLAKAEMKRFHK